MSQPHHHNTPQPPGDPVEAPEVTPAPRLVPGAEPPDVLDDDWAADFLAKFGHLSPDDWPWPDDLDPARS